MIPFTNLPENIRVPLFYAELDASQANSAQLNQRTLIIGQMTDTGTGEPGTPVISAGVGDARARWGSNSMLAAMTAAYRAADSFGEVWYLPLEDATGAVAASGTVTLNIEGDAGVSGVISLYIAGRRYQLPVQATQSAADIAEALATLVAADAFGLVSASAQDNVVTLTAINAGMVGNEIDVRLNYGGSRAGESTPLNLHVAIAPMAGGAINPTDTLQAALDNCGDMPFDFIVCPYTDSVSLDALHTFLNDQTGRWSWAQQIYGHAFAAYRGTLAACTTFGAGRNNQHESVLGFHDSPTPAWIVAAQLAGSVAPALRNDPGRPVQTLPIRGMLAPPVASRFLLTERNTLLYDGISTFNVGDDGTCYAENITTTYQKNPWGDPDDSYLEVETMFLLVYVLRALRSMVTSKYSRMKLAADGTRFASGSAIVTPLLIRADVIARYQELEFDGYVQNSALFARQLIVEQNANNPNRVDCLWPGTLIDQLRIFALLAQFRLS
ncbi:phage tail sheath gpL-like [Paraburkholderia sp. HC6.4b]|uniref:phage tail sheath subtilisin-like domain-containing protein n=1 Tax=unclassified Paraburkholderia TaxID=2615204 RepID=UPI00160E03D8|nr:MULTISPECIES: phage tail sheath subtilisin-like domain-containing protein [unclassified Paraburkholderia]MBB5408605.1 phage tail sheath gpL-like [Paraburkholderia sp. HC6.4b]MBB5450437.1 phage tail sheath gpL-like [Paraburkholderia sp. Kb1A]